MSEVWCRIHVAIVAVVLSAGCGSSGGADAGPPDANFSDVGGGIVATDAKSLDGAGSPDGAGRDARADGGSGGGDGAVAAAPTLCPKSGLISEAAGPLPSGVHVLSGATPELAYYAFDGDKWMYWATQDGAIHRLSLADGADSLLLDRTPLDNHIQGLAVDADGLYFLEGGLYNPLGVAKMPLDGSGAPTTLASVRSLWGIGIGEGYVYYYDATQEAIMRVPTKGGNATAVLRDVDPVGMWVAGGYLYFRHPHANVSVYHVLRVKADRVAPDAAPDGGLPVDAGTDAASDGVPAGAEEIATTGPFGATPVTDSVNVYWGDSENLMFAPLAGGPAKVLATTPTKGGLLSSQNDVSKIIPAAGSLYWSAFPFGSGCGDISRTTVSPAQTSIIVPYVGAGLGSVSPSYLYLLGGEVLRLAR